MRLHTHAMVATLFIGALMAANAFAATVTFTLDLTGAPGTFKLTALDSLGDNGGIASYGVPLTGPILTLDHRAPYAVSASNFAPIGFSNLRSADGNANIFAGQALSGPAENFLYGIGQTPSSFIVPLAGLPDLSSDLSWTVPVVIAVGTYNPAQGTPGFVTGTPDLFSNVFESKGNSLPRISAQVFTQILEVPEPATLSLVGLAMSGLVGATSIRSSRIARKTNKMRYC